MAAGSLSVGGSEKALEEDGYLDFLPNLCYIDQITCSAAHGKLIRHKTLADGDGECNYWILGDKDPDALADVGSK